jgi:hypothetical protein
MARIINFYIPASFRRKTSKPLPPEERGKVIRFTQVPRKKTA